MAKKAKRVKRTKRTKQVAVASREIRLARAKALIIAHPAWGRIRVNKELRKEYGIGLRTTVVQKLKDTTLIGRPRAATGRKSVAELLREELITPERMTTIGFDEAYHKMRSAGFINMEIRNIFSAGNTPMLFTTEPFKAMLVTRRKWFRDRVQSGWSKGQIIDAIKKYYDVKGHNEFDFLRKEYKPPLRVDFRRYREIARKRAMRDTKKLYGQKKVPVTIKGRAINF